MKLKALQSDIDIEAVIFDLDGTLADSMWMWTDIDIEYLARFGYVFEKQLQTDIAGMSMQETAVYFKNRYHIPLSVSEIIQDWIRMSIDKYKNEVPLKAYAGELLAFLKAGGVKTAIASSNAIESVMECLKSNGIMEMLDVVVTSDQVPRGKPFPDVYLYAASLLGTDPAACLVFEDIPAGIIAARSAGMKVFAVYDRFSEEDDDEKRRLSDAYFTDFGEFLRGEGVTDGIVDAIK